MRFWPFGRKSDGVEFVTRVVTAVAVDGSPIRARMTVHFVEPTEAEDADPIADRATSALEKELRRAHDPTDARSLEPGLSKTVLSTLEDSGVTGLRKVEVAGVHAVRLVTPSVRPAARDSSPPVTGWSAQRPPSWGPPGTAQQIDFAPPAPEPRQQEPAPSRPPPGALSTRPPPAPIATRSTRPPLSEEAPRSTEVIFSPPPSRVSPAVVAVAAVPGLIPAPPRVPTGAGGPAHAEPQVPPKPALGAPLSQEATPLGPEPARPPSVRPRSRPSARFRAVTHAIFVPRGASSEEIARAVHPVVSDTSARVLVGSLRFYDLLALRGVSMTEVNQDMLAAVTPVSDAPCGQYEQSRSGEIERWRQTLGVEALGELHHECRLLAMYLLHEALVAVRVQRQLALSTLEALSASTARSRAGGAPDIARYVHLLEASVPAQFVSSFAGMLGLREPPPGMDRAIGTVLANVQEELRVAAMVVELSQRA